MPIYMDRHDIPGVTAKDVAEAHQKDLEIQDQYNCCALTYWFDEGKGVAFCLIEAPDKESVKHMHKNSHGLIPHQVIEVNSALVEAFLGRIKDPDPIPDSSASIIDEPAFRTILAINITTGESLSGSTLRAEFENNFKVFSDKLYAILNKYRGVEAKQYMHDCLCSFVSADQALLFANDMRNNFNLLSTTENSHFNVQIGISAGNPIMDDHEIFGKTIESAKNLCYISSSNRIMISESVVEHLRRKELEPVNYGEYFNVISSMQEDFLNHLIATIEKNLKTNNYSLKDLSSEMGVSKSTLYREVMATTQLPPHDFLKEYRLNKSLQLLRRRDSNISEVAYKTGFNSPSYFSKCFKKHFGILPSSYTESITI